LKLLGPPTLEADGHPVEIGRRKALALLAYLAATEAPHSRDALATLFWPACGQSQARANLRTCLSTLNQNLGHGLLAAEQETVTLASGPLLWTDVRDFQGLLEGCPAHSRRPEAGCPECLSRLEEAAALYRNDFLFGFSLPDCRDFDEWQFQEAERLRAELAAALRLLAEGLEAGGRAGQAIVYARRRIVLDPLEEAAHRQLMRLYAADGRQAAALRQYRECLRMLREELGVEPDRETAELGSAIERRQIRAGREGPAGSKAGPQEAPAPAEELRLITVLVAGVSPSVDRVWGERLEDMTALIAPLLRFMEEVLAKHGAHREPNAGEDVLAVFGAPVSHEDDAERAVRAGLFICERAERLGLDAAVGIDTGMIYAAGQALLGPTVNRASRLRYQNCGNQVLVSAATRRRTFGTFEFEPFPFEWPGRQQAETAYRAIAEKHEPEKPYGIDGLRARLVGREAEMHALQQVLARTMEGQGQFVTLAGEAGVGKSRLVRELRALPLSSPASWHWGRCRELGGAEAYGPFLEILRGYFGLTSPEGEQARAQRVMSCLQELATAQRWPVEHLEEIGSVLGSLLFIRYGSSWDKRLGTLGPQQVQQRTFQALCGLFSAIGRERPTVLVLEDLHWSDSLSLDLLALLMETLTDLPLLLVCVYRADRQHKCWNLAAIAQRKCPERHTEILLRELDTGHSRALAEDLLGMHELPPPLERMIADRSRGNPLFIEEVLRSLIDVGAIVRGARGWNLRGGELPRRVPENIQALTQGRIDRLRPEERQVLQSAAAIGEIFRRRVLERILPAGLPVEQVLRSLADAALVYDERSFPEPEHAFRHALIQEAVYQSIPQQKRTQLHRLIAGTMEELFADRLEELCEQLALHYDRGGLPEKSSAFLLQAGEKALGRYQSEQAVGHFRRALDLSTDRQQRLRALAGLGRAHYLLEQSGDMQLCYRQALELAAELGLSAGEKVPLYYGLGLSLHYLGLDEEAARVASEGLSMLGGQTDSEEAIRLQLLLAWSHCRLDSVRSTEMALALAGPVERLDYTEEVGLAQVSIAESCYISRRRDEASIWYERVQRQAERHNDLVTLAELHRSTAWHAFMRGELREAIRDHLAAVEVCRRLGDSGGISISWLQTGWFLEFLGELEEAWNYDEKLLELAEGLAKFYMIEILRADLARNLGTICFARNDVEQGLAHLDRALGTYWATIEEIQMPFARTINIALVAKALLTLGRKEEALRILLRLFESAPHRIPQHVHQSRVGMALALSGMEEAMEDPAAFVAFCREYRARYPEVESFAFQQWQLEPSEPRSFGRELVREDFAGPLPAEWGWQDACGDGAYRLAGGLEIRAANGRDLWRLNTGAPRLMRRFAGSFAVQTTCGPALADRPALGGLALWQDEGNFLALEMGSMGRRELTFRGCLEGRDGVFGRGRLPSERAWLRLERAPDGLRALCSSDGRSWHLIGEAAGSLRNEVQVGLFASGWIDRSYYHGAFPDGAAISFESFAAWEGGSR
jgi:DNA-binding SARP family transcriptional activator